MLTERDINRELKSIKEREERLLASLETLKNMSPAQELAVELHQGNCNPDTKCSFRYEGSWNGLEHKAWLEKAEMILKITNAETALHVLRVIKGHS